MRTVVQSRTVSGPVTIDIPRNPDRTLLMFSTRDQAITLVIGVEVEGVMRDFFSLAQAQSKLEINSAKHGDMPTLRWQISLALGNETIVWVEGFLPESYLRVPPEYFNVNSAGR